MTFHQHFFLRISDITINLMADDPEIKLQVEGAMKKFIVREAKPNVTIEARWDDLSKEIKGDKVFDSGALWQLYKENGTFMSQKATNDNESNPPSPPFSKGGQGGIIGGLKGFSEQTYIFCFTSPALGSTPYKIALVNKNYTSGKVLLHRPYFDTDQPVYPLEYPLDELLFINYLALSKGVEVHACGIIDSKGRGHLFVGQSGAGKTTIAMLWQDESGGTILSDDRIILRKIEDTIWMYGTPWHGEAMVASPAKVPLTRIYFLARGEKNGLAQQKKIDSLSRLFACSFVPFYNPEGLDFTLAFFEEVMKMVPCYELRFVPGKKTIEFVKEFKD